jgi:hypothetical protein
MVREIVKTYLEGSISTLVNCRNARPLGVVMLIGYARQFHLKSRWRSHESGEKPHPMGGDRPIQTISLV